MGEILRDKTKQKIIRIVLMAVMVIFMVYPVFRYTAPYKSKDTSQKLDTEWKVTINDKVLENVTLSSTIFGLCNKDDVVTYERNLPNGTQVDNAFLNLYTIHSAVQVFVDGRRIYSYGLPDYAKGNLLGYGEHMIPMPQQYAGKSLKVVLYVSENNAFDGQSALYIVNHKDYLQYEVAGKRNSLAISLFLIVFGIIIMCLSLVMLFKAKNFTQTFCIAMFSFLIGCWTLCNQDLVIIFTQDLKVKAYMEYLTFYFVPIPFTYYFRNRIEEKQTPKFVRVYFWTLLSAELIFFVSACILQFMNIVHFPNVLFCVHMLMFFALILIFILSVVDAKNKIRQRNSVTVGFIIAAVACVYELLYYNLGKYFIGFSENEFNSAFCYAVLIIVISLLIDFGKGITQSLYKEAQQKILFQLAYMDELTGLANRRRCEELLAEYSKDNISYAVISLDMNFLKKVNDTQGHDKGDAMLKRFADTLTEVFSLHGTVGRMGGDEFIVLMPDSTAKEVEKLLKELDAAMNHKNIEEPSITLSTAYGFAMSYEADSSRNVHAVYQLADNRMYDNKRKSKLGRTD